MVLVYFNIIISQVFNSKMKKNVYNIFLFQWSAQSYNVTMIYDYAQTKAKYYKTYVLNNLNNNIDTVIVLFNNTN